MKRFRVGAYGALLVVLVAGTSSAQKAGDPGDFDYYSLVLSWSPTYCASNPGSRKEPQCSGGRPYAFVLHGLWPQYERGWPEFCRTRKKPWVPRGVMNDMLDIMPSKRLVIHQYRKHGTCSGLQPTRYFQLSRLLFERVAIPRRFVRPSKPIRTRPRDIKEAFLKANPDLAANMISVSCGSRRRLREIKICMTREGLFRACGRNEQKRRCRRGDVILPPVRAGQTQKQDKVDL